MYSLHLETHHKVIMDLKPKITLNFLHPENNPNRGLITALKTQLCLLSIATSQKYLFANKISAALFKLYFTVYNLKTMQQNSSLFLFSYISLSLTYFPDVFKIWCTLSLNPLLSNVFSSPLYFYIFPQSFLFSLTLFLLSFTPVSLVSLPIFTYFSFPQFLMFSLLLCISFCSAFAVYI